MCAAPATGGASAEFGLHYTAQRGYTGPDSIGAEVVYSSGRYRRGTFNIYVR